MKDLLDGTHSVDGIDRLLIGRTRSEDENFVILELDSSRTTSYGEDPESSERHREDGDERVDGADDGFRHGVKISCV